MTTDPCLKPEQSELGKKSAYDSTYNADKLFIIPRKINREAIGIHSNSLPFCGFDYWNHYEVSWLNEKGKPIVALAEIIYGCDSLNIIESKSMKLYFNSLNNTPFKDVQTVQAIVQNDLETRLNGSSLIVRITPINDLKEEKLLPRLNGLYIDELDIECTIYNTEPAFLKTENEMVEETLCSDLLKSNCLVTNQPDWCSVQIVYKGKKINQEGLLRYIVSFRNDNEFHEQCIEKIFMHIMERCQPSELTVYGRSTRRGGLDINSIRSTKQIEPEAILNMRLCRQ
jgi:7-cyano-7-deazaguanine reductase